MLINIHPLTIDLATNCIPRHGGGNIHIHICIHTNIYIYIYNLIYIHTHIYVAFLKNAVVDY